jgi:hypothetical protein
LGAATFLATAFLAGASPFAESSAGFAAAFLADAFFLAAFSSSG